MRKLLLFLLLLFPSLAYGQDSVYRTKLVNPVSGEILPNALVTVCAEGASLINLPCTPPTTIHTTAAGDVVKANPFRSDARGNVEFYGVTGTAYVVSVTAVISPGYSYKTEPLGTGGGGGGVGGFANVTTVTYSATPTFTITGNDVFRMTLTGNITSMTLSGTPAAGWREQFQIIQSPDQNKTIVWPASFLQKPAISPDAGSVTIIDVVYNGTNWILENTTRPSYVARYVAVTGNDANDGMTRATAKLTLVGAAESCIFGTTSQYTQVGGPKTTGSYCNIFFEDNIRANPDGTQYGYWIMGDQDSWALANPAAFAAGTLPTGWRKNSGVMVNLIGIDCIENSSNGTGSTCAVIGGTGQKGFPLIWLSHVGGLSIHNMKGYQAYLAINSDLTRTVVSAAQTVNIAFTNSSFGSPGEVTAGAGASPGIDIGAGAFWIWIKRGVTHVPFNFGSISALVRTSGVTTATTSAAHAFIVGDTFTILDALEDSFNSIKGNNDSASFTVATVADNTHFTFAQAGKPDLTVGAGGTAFNDSQYCVRISNGSGLIFIEDMNCNGGGVGIFGSNSGNVHVKNMTVEGDFARPTTPVLMIQGNTLGAIDVEGGGLSDTLTQAHAVVVNEPNNPYNADKVVVKGLNGINLGPFTALSPFGTSSTNANPFAEGQVGFIRGRALGLSMDDYHSSPMFVRFPNLIGASGTWTIVNTAPCATAILTSSIADPDGGTNAHHVAATTAECQADIRFYNTSTSISTGDLFIVKIRVRGTNLPDGIRGAGADILNIRGLDNQPLDLQWETAAFNQGDGDWQTITAVYKLAAITTGNINPDITLTFRTEHPLDFYMPYAAFIESGVISDSEAINVATTLRPYPSTCSAGQLCSANGVVTTSASDVAYDATTWNANTDAPTKNAVRDKIETLAGGVPTTITVADTTDTTSSCALFESATGDLGPKTDAGCTYNATTGVLTATGLAGPLTGNVTGNVTGTSGSATGNAATATALQTARTIGGTSFNGTANIVPGTATALAANGANCSAANYPLGVDASGAAEGCTAAAAIGPGTTIGDTRYCSTTATPCVESRIAIGATGDYYSVVGGIPAWSTPGVVPDQRTTATEAVTCADRGQMVTFANAGNIAASIVSSASCGNNFYFNYKVIGPGNVTFTPTTSTIQVNETAAAATMIAIAGQQGAVVGDNTNFFATRTGGIRFTPGGDAVVAGDIALGAGWGSTAAVSAVTGHDQAFNFTVTTGGTGIAANPTFTMTFTDGTWTLSPIFICTQTGGNDVLADVTFTSGVTTATTIPGIWNGTPTTGMTYIITCIGVGR